MLALRALVTVLAKSGIGGESKPTPTETVAVTQKTALVKNISTKDTKFKQQTLQPGRLFTV